MVEQLLALSLPKDHKWLAAKSIASSKDVSAIISSIRPEMIQFSTGLFRCGEYFKFEALAEVPSAGENDRPNSIRGKLVDAIIPSHRIADTGKIRSVILPPESYRKRKMKRMLIGPGLLVITSMLMLVILLIRGQSVEMRFAMASPDGSIAEVKADPRSDGYLHVKSSDKSIDIKILPNEFFSKANLEPKIVPDLSEWYALLFTSIFYVFVPAMWLLLAIRENRKWIKLRKQIGLDG